MTYDVVGFGALNLDKLYQVNKIAGEDDESFIKDLSFSSGGSAANTMIGLSRLGLNVALIGKVADDPEGKLLTGNLADEGVSTSGIIKSEEGRSGSVMGFVDPKGQRALYVDPGVNDEIKIDEINMDVASKTKILHLTSFVGDSLKAQEKLLDRISGDVKVSLDPGRIYAEKGSKHLRNILERTDILLMNETELKLLTEKKYKTIEDEIESLRIFDIDIIVVKMGKKGSYATDGEQSHFTKAISTECMDTTGAGDAYNTGFLFGLINGEKLEDSCLLGNYVASCSVEDFGATKNLPKSSKLKDLLKNKPK